MICPQQQVTHCTFCAMWWQLVEDFVPRQDGEVHCLTLAALRTLTLDFLMVLPAVLNWCAFLRLGLEREREDSYSFKEFECWTPENLGWLEGGGMIEGKTLTLHLKGIRIPLTHCVCGTIFVPF